MNHAWSKSELQQNVPRANCHLINHVHDFISDSSTKMRFVIFRLNLPVDSCCWSLAVSGQCKLQILAYSWNATVPCKQHVSNVHGARLKAVAPSSPNLESKSGATSPQFWAEVPPISDSSFPFHFGLLSPLIKEKVLLRV